ncbi:MAG: hypothetical protein M3325_13105, partial [Actinomycetota bacterium]|nr:hypothetical protein [Actinomycetota bacterium]
PRERNAHRGARHARPGAGTTTGVPQEERRPGPAGGSPTEIAREHSMLAIAHPRALGQMCPSAARVAIYRTPVVTGCGAVPTSPSQNIRA